MKGTKRSRCTPSRYRSSGSLRVRSTHRAYRLEVEITVTLLANRLLKSRCIIIASATSVTWNSSKNSTLFRAAMLRAMSGNGSEREPDRHTHSEARPYFWRNWCSFMWISSMNEWKSTRAFLMSAHWIELYSKSIRYVFPQPGPPQMYTPFGAA